jgi:hypothetical protein
MAGSPGCPCVYLIEIEVFIGIRCKLELKGIIFGNFEFVIESTMLLFLLIYSSI